jgi:putative hydrolase of the HAD superfamily
MFLYFDLGNVLLYFSHERACRQMAEVASTPQRQVTATEVRRVVFESGLEDLYESGELTTAEFYVQFCRQTGTRPDLDRLMHAASDIFAPNDSLLPLLPVLRQAGHRLGLLSNTNEVHWNFIGNGKYGHLPGTFDVLALSFRLGTMKPRPEIFEKAAELAGVPPREIFYTDDRPEHIAAARQANYDAVQYTTTPELLAELHRRGIKANIT